MNQYTRNITKHFKMSETTDILHSEGLEGVEKIIKNTNKELFITEIVCMLLFIAFIFASYFGLKYADTCEIQDKVITKQQEIIQCYKSQSIMVNDYIKKGEVKVLRPKR